MKHGYLAIVLHAHLPFVRHPEHENALEENWLAEAITESYVPLLLVLDGLVRDRVDFRLTVSLSPPLSSMLRDPLLQSRYRARMERSIALAQDEIGRTAGDPEFRPLARMYHDFFSRVQRAYVDHYGGDLVHAFGALQESGHVEIVAGAATHGYLPLLAVDESAVRTQVRVGVEHYVETFGRRPRGFWLPECAYAPALDAPLRENGIRFTVLETHGITRANPRPRFGAYAPLHTPAGLAVFGRDPDCSRQVWSSIEGYPGDFDYREFYRDIGYDLASSPHFRPDGIRVDTGIKYYRITGKGDRKEIYDPERARKKAEEHAAHFLRERLKQAELLAPMMDRAPLVVAPYDAELFGHWWFEGPMWLDFLIRKIAAQDTLRLTTLSGYLERYPANQTAVPASSSWGSKGFNEVWLNGRNDWIYPELHAAAASLENLRRADPAPAGLALRAMNQAARELLLAQASDWAFMIQAGTTAAYATRRTKTHLLRVLRLAGEIQDGYIDEPWLAALEAQDNIFPRIAVAADFLDRNAGSAVEPAEPTPVAVVRPPARFHVVMVAPEIVPFAKTGGLADMVASLASALERLGQKVSLLLPAHRAALACGLSFEDTGIRLRAPVSNRREEAALLRTTVGRDISAYLIRADRYFDRNPLYGTPQGDYADNAERFVFFCRAALEALRRIGPAHVLHAHDWQAALAIAFLKAQPEVYPELSAVRTVLTAHNLGYQGRFWKADWHLLNLDWSFFTPRHLEAYGQINFLKGGLVWADAITTVSPTYAREIRAAGQGFGLEGVLESRAGALAGILNGADYESWNPATDPLIAAPYSPEDVSGKRQCKTDLQRLCGLAEDPDVPLLGMVTRLAEQKGVDLLQAVFDQVLARGLQFVLLGTGDARFQDFFRWAAGRYPARAAARIAFDEALAHKIEAGADLFLMPSRYEPAGLNQLYSMKYGAIPVVRSTGGLRDSVTEFDPATGEGAGFLFEPYDGGALLAALDRALAVFREKPRWETLQRNAMTADFSWSRSAREYLRLYRHLAEGEPAAPGA
jgi:1,4-alpha-glucan branching enzyme